MTTEVTPETVTAFNNNNSYTSVITTNVNNRFFVEDEDRIAANRQALQAADLAPVHPSLYTAPTKPDVKTHSKVVREIVRCIFEKELSSSNENKKTSKDDYFMIFIWDIEEVTQLSWNYVADITQCYPEVNAACLYELVERILMSVNFNSSSELKEGNIVNIDDEVDVESEFIKRVAPKYNALRQLYNEIRVLKNYSRETWNPFVASELVVRSGMLERNIEIKHATEDMYHLCHGRWENVLLCMDMINKGSQKTDHKYGNVVLSGDGIGYGAVQLLVSGHSGQVEIDKIYSTANVSKESVFEKIRIVMEVATFAEAHGIQILSNRPEVLRKLAKLFEDIVLMAYVPSTGAAMENPRIHPLRAGVAQVQHNGRWYNVRDYYAIKFRRLVGENEVLIFDYACPEIWYPASIVRLERV